MTRYTGYILCTSPRSGSTLLCTLLEATGIAGAPESLFYPPDLEDWRDRLGVPPIPDERDLLSALVAAALHHGRAGTDIFALRQQRHSFAFLCQKLAVLYPDQPTDLARLQRAFGNPLFIHLTRQDKVAQAVSFLKAEQTGLWHVAPDGSDFERTGQGAPAYDAEKIRAKVETLTAYDSDWTAWFRQQGIEPLRLTYHELSAAPAATLHRVLESLGLDPQAADGIEPGVRKMADARSQDWIARFRAEAGVEAGKA